MPNQGTVVAVGKLGWVRKNISKNKLLILVGGWTGKREVQGYLADLWKTRSRLG